MKRIFMGILYLLLLVLHLLEAFSADVLSFYLDNICSVVAEYAGRLILAKNDIVALDEDLDGICVLKVECGPEFFGNYDPSELVQFSDYTCSFHFASPYLYK